MKKVFLLFLMGTMSLFAHTQSAARITHASITVSNLESLLPFYTEVLSFRKVGQYEWHGEPLRQLTSLADTRLKAKIAVLQLGQEQIELIEYLDETRQSSLPNDSRSNDLWFQHIAIVVSDMDSAYNHLRRHKVQHVSTAPQTLPDYIPAAAGIKAFYFRDPDGHNLEVIQYPAGKGNPKWQQNTTDLFLGIDHTAIGIEDTDASVTFYEKPVGLKAVGDSENFGPEQERLNQVFGAHLLITGLTAKSGFGLEFLDYLAPPGGRPYPVDSRPTDLWHWHTGIQVNDIEEVYQNLQKANSKFISNGIVTINNATSKRIRAFLVKDPDGHVLLIFE